MARQVKNLNWSIKIGSQNKKIFPKERLEKYLNFDPKTERELAEFCTIYQIIPQGLFLEEDNLISAFKKEQSIMKAIAEKIANGLELNEDDWRIINRNLGHIKKSKTVLSSSEIDKFNQISSGEINPLTPGNYPLDTVTHANTTASLWVDLSNSITSKLFTCVCGAFYKRLSGHEQKYCTINCGNNQRQKKFRKKKQ